ncbi:MAG TPA: PIG-L deacetylase family protein [Fibrobacteria bacterium]|nr:PIG-L deacetylase family protein [Fibrobacteria bacterium]
MKSTVLVVAAHPDDEVLGCGATMAAHARKGDRVHVLILAEGLTSRDPERNRGSRAGGLSRLARAARKAHSILGVSGTTLEAFPDNRMDSVPLLDVVKVIESRIAAVRPDVIYTHHAGDLNIDHRVVHQAVATACRPLPGTALRSLLCFEVPSSTEWQIQSPASAFAPNWHVDVTDTLALKLKALKAYASEMRPWPHSRSLEAVEHLARWRGASAGWDAAEAFMLGRHRAF